MIHLDTHVVVWLYAGEIDRFPAAGHTAMEDEDLCVSPAVIMELQYLQEIGRISADSPLILETLAASVGLTVADTPFHEVVMEALPESWTRDPFDRLIVAQAKAEKVRLITKDNAILDHYSEAFWD
jgi:PIN domain nuclease of toxin-antitoxin system